MSYTSADIRKLINDLDDNLRAAILDALLNKDMPKNRRKW